jgi:hypothetical protein
MSDITKDVIINLLRITLKSDVTNEVADEITRQAIELLEEA